MKTISSDLNTHINLEVTTLARCWHIVRTDGVEFFFTAHDVDLLVGSDNYLSSAGFQNTAIESKSDLTVDNLEVVGIFDSETISIEDLRAGLFDYADVYIFLVNWQDTTQGPLKMRRGKLGECVMTPQGFFNVELRGLTQLLQQEIVETYSPTCRADVFDARCALNKADYECTGHVTTVTDGVHIVVSLDTTGSIYTANDGWFQYGVLKWDTGDNAGRAVEVKFWNHTSGAIELYVPTGYPVQVGDTFKIYPGCDKTVATCRDKFSNILNFRGEAYLPGNDKAFYYPDVGGGSG